MTTTVQATNLAVFAGRFVGATGSSGNAEIKDDGTGRFDVADLTACPSCSTASAPRMTIDFRFAAAAPAGAGGFTGTGVITGQSNPTNAIARQAGGIGAPMEVTLTSAGGLSLSFLGADNVLVRTGGAVPTTASPSARSDTGPGTFVSPTQNIGCVITRERARCDIRQRDWQPPPEPADCNLDWGSYLGVSAQGPGTFRCVGDTAFAGSTVLPYGSIARRGSFECRSQEIGMKCLNLDTGHGIFLSRGEYKLS